MEINIYLIIMEIDFTCLTNKQFQTIKKGRRRKVIKNNEKVKTEIQLLQHHENMILNTYNNNYSNIHHWLMKE